MSLGWRKCFLCNGFGELTIVSRFDRLFKLRAKDAKCPLCKGRGSLAVKIAPFKPWNKPGDKK